MELEYTDISNRISDLGRNIEGIESTSQPQNHDNDELLHEDNFTSEKESPEIQDSSSSGRPKRSAKVFNSDTLID